MQLDSLVPSSELMNVSYGDYTGIVFLSYLLRASKLSAASKWAQDSCRLCTGASQHYGSLAGTVFDHMQGQE